MKHFSLRFGMHDMRFCIRCVMTYGSRTSFSLSSFGILRFQRKVGTDELSGEDARKKPQPVSDATPAGAACAVAFTMCLTSLTISDDASDITRFSTYLWAACSVNVDERLCVFLAVSFASGMCAIWSTHAVPRHRKFEQTAAGGTLCDEMHIAHDDRLMPAPTA